jgi:hypothetical protein
LVLKGKWLASLCFIFPLSTNELTY